MACVADQEASPEYDPSVVSRLDLIEQCADCGAGKRLRGMRSARRVGAPADVCGVSYEQFATEQLPACKRGLVNKQLDGMCVFGERYGDVRRKPEAVVVLSARTLHATDPLSSLEKQADRRSSPHHGVHRCDDRRRGHSRQSTRTSSTRWSSGMRAIAGRSPAMRWGAGDNSFGMIFEQGTTTRCGADQRRRPDGLQGVLGTGEASVRRGRALLGQRKVRGDPGGRRGSGAASTSRATRIRRSIVSAAHRSHVLRAVGAGLLGRGGGRSGHLPARMDAGRILQRAGDRDSRCPGATLQRRSSRSTALRP